MGLRPTAVSLVQKASKYPPCPFKEGDIVEWLGLKLRVKAIGVETLHCGVLSDPVEAKPNTRVPIAQCQLVEAAPGSETEQPKQEQTELFVSTSGNYVGLSRQVQQHWEKQASIHRNLLKR